ncbi:mitochondrial carrier domain-containing protein, partial [Desarmillaria tabescens]
ISMHTSVVQALTSIIWQGPSELFRGFFASSLRDTPYASLFMVFYEGIKQDASLVAPPTSSSQSAAIHSASAVLAGGMSTLLTHPFNVIKTKIQARSEDRYHGFMRMVVMIWKQGGVSGYFDGASLCLTRKVLSSAIAWAVYEGVLLFMRT